MILTRETFQSLAELLKAKVVRFDSIEGQLCYQVLEYKILQELRGGKWLFRYLNAHLHMCVWVRVCVEHFSKIEQRQNENKPTHLNQI